MANHRPAVPATTKRALLAEAGGKCANPGCATRMTELHHIDEWAVYGTHDESSMIALCPTCHGHVHRGELRIDDATLYRWKSIERPPQASGGAVYVEPGDNAKMLLGSVAVTGPAGLLVFRFAPGQEVSFALKDQGVFLLNIRVTDATGQELLRVVDGHIRHEVERPLVYESRTGLVRLTAPVAQRRFLPDWALEQMRAEEITFGRQGRITMLELEVMSPGLVRVEGIWASETEAVVITRERMSFVEPGRPRPISLMGVGADSVLNYVGPITTALFGFGARAEYP